MEINPLNHMILASWVAPFSVHQGFKYYCRAPAQQLGEIWGLIPQRQKSQIWPPMDSFEECIISRATLYKSQLSKLFRDVHAKTTLQLLNPIEQKTDNCKQMTILKVIWPRKTCKYASAKYCVARIQALQKLLAQIAQGSWPTVYRCFTVAYV